MITSPQRGAPITATWATKVTDAANAFNAQNVKRFVDEHATLLNSASEHPFKIKLFKEGENNNSPKYTICLPPNSVMWGAKALNAQGDMVEAKVKNGKKASAGGNAEATESSVDGRFQHCYVFEASSGTLEKKTEGAGENQIEYWQGEIYALVYSENDNQKVAFVIAKISAADASDLQERLNDIAPYAKQRAVFCVARITKYGIEQIAKGAMAYDGASGGDVVLCKITGQSDAGYEVSIYGNGRGERATGTGIVSLVEIALGAEIPNGTWILAHPMKMDVTGGEA